jgi:hypothetical protein
MATARKTTVDPLAEELPDEPRPQHALDVQFEVQIVPYIVTGTVFYRWTILKNNKRGWAGDYAGHNESGYATAEARRERRCAVRRAHPCTPLI